MSLVSLVWLGFARFRVSLGFACRSVSRVARFRSVSLGFARHSLKYTSLRSAQDSKNKDFAFPFIDANFSNAFIGDVKSRREKFCGSGIGAGCESIAKLMQLQPGGEGKTDNEVREIVSTWLNTQSARSLLDLCVTGMGGGSRASTNALRPHQKEALVEVLASEVRQSTGRTIILDAPCNGGKTLVSMFMSLLFQKLMAVKVGGRYWVNLLVYPNVNVMYDQAEVSGGASSRGEREARLTSPLFPSGAPRTWDQRCYHRGSRDGRARRR